MNKIAVIMSIYKNDILRYTRMAVESILNQTYGDIDFYIMYDGPISEEVDQYLSSLNDSRLIIRRRSNNRGLAQSLNDLLSIVMPKGYEYIARMDADDISEINRFECQIQYMEQHPEVECLGTWAVEIMSDGSEFYRKKMPETHEECKQLFHKRDCMIHPTVMFRRSYIEKAGLYPIDTYFEEDTMMWAHGFATGCTFANVPEYLFRYRLDDNFFKRRRGWKYAKSIFLIRHKINKMLHFGPIADMWAFLFAVAKMMPTFILRILYKTVRR